MAAPILRDGPVKAPATFLLAHGAGAPMDSPFLQMVAGGLASCGWQVVRFEFPYMARSRQTGKRSAPNRMPVLEACFREQVAALQEHAPLIIGGKSMGGRVATHLLDALAASTNVQAGVCLGYPFHPPGQPDRLRTEHLINLKTPLLVLQGERDTFGQHDEVAGYGLSDCVSVHWLADGDHSFKPRKRSGLDWDHNLAAAVAAMDQFAQQVVG
ncbi:MAG: alpha/beta fold hydrolase [Synechococcus sp.]